MKHWKFLFIAMLFISYSCNNIDSLKHQKVKFKDLPSEVAEYLRNPTDTQNDIQTMLLELPKGEKKRYKLETVKTWMGPWVSHEKLIDLEREKHYKIDQGVPSPYIVYKNKLYIPDEYNMFTAVDNIESLGFTQYDLE